jgi:hypothetical protein
MRRLRRFGAGGGFIVIFKQFVVFKNKLFAFLIR